MLEHGSFEAQDSNLQLLSCFGISLGPAAPRNYMAELLGYLNAPSLFEREALKAPSKPNVQA